MHFTYGFCNENSLAALWEYQYQYPNWRQLYHLVFEMMHHNLTDTGTHMTHASVGHGRFSVWDQDTLYILQHNPLTST
jgi:hypothetical protein